MASTFCHYDCRENRTKAEIPSNPDISGLGTLLAYTISAALAVGIVIISYIAHYRPDISFKVGKNGQTLQCLSHCNEVDRALLFWRLRKREKAGVDPKSWSSYSRVVLLHCMLVISDFQLITGISILVSGFTQLRCGITAFHWHKTIRLAWLSSITHLSCLTFLGGHFHRNSALRLWRICAMILLIIMLIVAKIPTKKYTFLSYQTYRSFESFALPNPQSYAICYFYKDRYPDAPLWIGEEGGDINMSELNELALAANAKQVYINIAFLVLGLSQRLLNLHPWIPRKLRHSRLWLQQKHNKWLVSLYELTRADKWYSTAADIVLYRMFLAAVLLMQSTIDVLCSTAFEILWVTLGFVWGLAHLWRREPDNKHVNSVPNFEPGRYEWSFGQVMTVLLLVPPIISLGESFAAASRKRNAEAAEEPSECFEGLSISDCEPCNVCSYSKEPPLGIWHPDHNPYLWYWCFPPFLYATLSNLAIIALDLASTTNGNWDPSLLRLQNASHRPYTSAKPMQLLQVYSSLLACTAFKGERLDNRKREVLQQCGLFLLFVAQIQAPFWYSKCRRPGMSFKEMRQGYRDGGDTADPTDYLHTFNILWMVICNLGICVIGTLYYRWKGQLSRIKS